MTQENIVIIGSGISALTAGILLAKKGKKVTLLEQYEKPGGYMHSFRRFGDTYETGAHYFGALDHGQPFRVLLEYLGVFDENLFTPLDRNGFDQLCFPEGRIEIPGGYDNAIQSIASHFPGERAAIVKYFEMIRNISAKFPTYRFNDTPETSLPREALEVSLQDIVCGLTQNPRLQSVFYSYCGLHGVNPEDVAFGFHAIITDSLIAGAYGLNGGGDAFTNRFVRVLENLGGEVLCNHKVTGLDTNERFVRTIRCENGAEFHADWVISSIHPKATLRLISDQSLFPPVFQERVKNLKESPTIFGLYTTLRSRPSLRPNKNYYFFQTSDPKGIFAQLKLGEAPASIFVTSHKRQWSETEKRFPMSLHTLAPYELFAPFAHEPYGHRSDQYNHIKEEVSKSMLKAIERFEPDFPGLVSRHVSSSPLTHLHFNGSEMGTSYGLYHSIQNTGARALGPRTKVLNLLLTGQNYLFPGLLGAATSALRTSGHIIGIKPIIRDLIEIGAPA